MRAAVRSDFIVRNVRLNGHTVRIREPRVSITPEQFLKEIGPVLKKIR
jgi:hypothetical protein